jgi:hypothetical protein
MPISTDAIEALAFFGSVASLAWSGAFAWAKWLNRPREGESLSGDAERRLHAIEVAVEAIAVEVERIGEAQRFAARLLEERLPPPERRAALPPGASGAGGRSTTPH